MELAITDRRFKLGFAQCIFLILLQAFYGLAAFSETFGEKYSIQTMILYQVTFAYAYISILFLVRRILTEFEYPNKLLSWIIKLEVLRAASLVFESLEIYYAGIIASVCNMILFVLFFLCVIWFTKNRKSESQIIISLKPLIWSMVTCSVVAASIDLYLEFNHSREFYGILYLVRAIPYLYLFLFLKKLKSMPTANTR